MQIAEYDNCMIIRRTQGGIPNLPFVNVKEAILGKKYELSLVFPNLQESEELHKQWKNKPGPVNTLSFPYDESSGEIIITLTQARSEAKKYGRKYKEHLLFLFIHSCLHLKGFDHGDKMEQEEHKFMKKFISKI
ncbi:MAG: rRNA maturation RNase YbeY [Candidatus Pacebacteria bacterium]|nr:rRNA maturation RNase YbeY [Candidatus Paceibacterota bacterium]